ncbi:hypothetical protein NKI54_34425 [Mesorhizobium sp. M0663]|uniref:hypothetical protein n=1 Tax=Mesorhizobium sp. M0663 TaxID=2956981 RepID=UPI0033385060
MLFSGYRLLSFIAGFSSNFARIELSAVGLTAGVQPQKNSSRCVFATRRGLRFINYHCPETALARGPGL